MKHIRVETIPVRKIVPGRILTRLHYLDRTDEEHHPDHKQITQIIYICHAGRL